jgi:hypothetical protein
MLNNPDLIQSITLGGYALLALLGAAFGLILADIDQNIPFIKHRSALTHGALWPLLALFLAQAVNPYIIAALFGFMSGYAVHLLFDMFPKQWHGIANIHVIGHIRLWPVLSFIWLFGGVLAAIYAISQWADVWLCGIALGLCFMYKAKSEDNVIMPLGFIFLVVAGVQYYVRVY